MTEKKIISILCAVTAASFLFVGGWLMGRGSRSEGLAALSPSVSAETGSSAEKEQSESAEAPLGEVSFPIDLNTADAKQLMALPGIGETLAGEILAYREAHGGFLQKEELLQVKGIGEKKFEALRELVEVGSPE